MLLFKNRIEKKNFFNVMAAHLYCSSCKEILSLEDVIKENRYGLASILTIECRKCFAKTKVPTGKKHPGSTGKKFLFDTNTKCALGKCKIVAKYYFKILKLY